MSELAVDWRKVLRDYRPVLLLGPPSEGVEVPMTTSSLQVTAEADTDGVMICLVPPVEVSEALLVEGGETLDNQHITLFYLGSPEEVGGEPARARIHQALFEFTLYSGHRPLTGHVGGYGVFCNGEENVLWASWDIPGLDVLRVDLMRTLARRKISSRSHTHGYTPHQTLRYSEVPIREVPELPELPEEVAFESLVLSWGEDWQAYPLV